MEGRSSKRHVPDNGNILCSNHGSNDADASHTWVVLTQPQKTITAVVDSGDMDDVKTSAEQPTSNNNQAPNHKAATNPCKTAKSKQKALIKDLKAQLELKEKVIESQKTMINNQQTLLEIQLTSLKTHQTILDTQLVMLKMQRAVDHISAETQRSMRAPENLATTQLSMAAEGMQKPFTTPFHDTSAPVSAWVENEQETGGQISSGPELTSLGDSLLLPFFDEISEILQND